MMRIKNKQTGLIWEIVDRAFQKRLLAQEHYEQVKVIPKKPASTKKEE